MKRLLDLQNDISKSKNAEFIGTTVRALVEGISKNDETRLTARMEQNKLVHFVGDPALTGNYVNIRITSAEAHALYGELSE